MHQNEFEQLLKKKMGLNAASVGSSTVERAVSRRMAACRLSGPAYWDLLQASTTELQELIEAVVVPETWFFRDDEVFTAFVRLVIEELLPTRRAEALRLLSVPCSTGEEPYSMAMALLDAGLTRYQFHIDAIDISERALAYAQEGLFGRNSFRANDLTFRDRYFRIQDDRYSIAEAVSDLVSFHRGNLTDRQFAFPTNHYDVIFCRNLLIYFDRPTRERTMLALNSHLTHSGILFVGHAEAYLAASSGFASVNHAMSFAFRKASEAQAKPANAFLPRAGVGPKKLSAPRLPTIIKRTVLTPGKPATAASASDGLAVAQALADAGKLQEAAESCERHIRECGASADAYYLWGVVRDAAGDLDAAADCYRRAVYLDPEHVEALTHLALRAESQGNGNTAERLRQRAQRRAANLENKSL